MRIIIHQFFNSYSTGCVNGYSRVSGLVGLHNYSSITNSYSTGTVTGEVMVGGLVGNSYSSSITHCYCNGNVCGDFEVGGLLGSIDETSTVAACFWDTETSGQSTSGGGTGKTTAEMLNITTYTDGEWDFVDETINGDDDIWGINSLHNNGYPYLADNSQEVGNDDPSEQILETTQLIGNYPNPFNPTTTISFNVKQRETATLEIYNIRGQKVKTFAAFKAGKHEVIWNGKDNEGKAVGSGVYFYRLSNGVSNQTRKMLMLK